MGFKAYGALPFYPGPVTIHPKIAKVMHKDFAPPRFGTEYTELYADLTKKIQKSAIRKMRRFSRQAKPWSVFGVH